MDKVYTIVISVAEFVVDVLDKKRIEEFRKHQEVEKNRSQDAPAEIIVDLDDLD